MVNRYWARGLEEHAIWAQAVMVEGPAGLVNNRDSGYGVSTIGSATDNGAAFFAIAIPSEFATLTKAVVVWFNGGDGNTVRLNITTAFAANGEGNTTHTDSIASADIATTLDELVETNITDALTGILAGDYVGIDFQREGSHANDTAGADSCAVLGVLLEYTT